MTNIGIPVSYCFILFAQVHGMFIYYLFFPAQTSANFKPEGKMRPLRLVCRARQREEVSSNVAAFEPEPKLASASLPSVTSNHFNQLPSKLKQGPLTTGAEAIKRTRRPSTPRTGTRK